MSFFKKWEQEGKRSCLGLVPVGGEEILGEGKYGKNIMHLRKKVEKSDLWNYSRNGGKGHKGECWQGVNFDIL
jgi:hypothetical protein